MAWKWMPTAFISLLQPSRASPGQGVRKENLTLALQLSFLSPNPQESPLLFHPSQRFLALNLLAKQEKV